MLAEDKSQVYKKNFLEALHYLSIFAEIIISTQTCFLKQRTSYDNINENYTVVHETHLYNASRGKPYLRMAMERSGRIIFFIIRMKIDLQGLI